MVVEAQQTVVLKGGVSTNPVNSDLNFRLRLDIGGANIRIADKLITDEETGRFYVDRESGLDMDFEIVKTADNKPNDSTITIWNLSDDTYLNIVQNGTALELYAAWSKDEYALMFRGYPSSTIKKSKDSKQTSSQGFLKQDVNAGRKGQNDIPTVLTCIDGKAQYEAATINKEYKNGVSTNTVINDLIQTFGVPIGYKDELEDQAIEEVMYDNYTARGKSVTHLNNFAVLLGFNWSITNGVFYLYTNEKPEKPYGIKLNSENSSSPERQNEQFTVTNKKTGKTTIKNLYMVRTKLLPWLNPGTYCSCDFGAKLQGVKYIFKVKHKGNNYGTVAESEVYIVDI